MLGGPSGDQHSLVANNSRWTAFTTVRCRTWQHENVVLLGDAAHTAHFSIGSGTKLAMEDAQALAACLPADNVPGALAAYEAERRPVVASTQRAAQASLEWFENIGQYADQDPHQFAFNIVTRSRRVAYDNLRLRDPEFVADMDRWFASAVTLDGPAKHGAEPRPPMFQPFRLGGMELANRVIVSPMDMYSACDGVPGDFHLVHLGSKALGGAGLVMTEMVCVSAASGHRRLHRDLHRRAGRVLAPDRRVRARADRRQDRRPARALRPQGLDQADVGRDGCPAAGRQLGGLRPVTHPVRGR